jgi:inosose dehydratase
MRVANAPCSWGALEFDWAGPAPAFARVLDEMTATGYAGTELGDWGFMPTDPAALQKELEGRRLAMLGAFVPVKLTDASAHDRGIEAALRVARLLNAVAGADPFVVLSDDTAANQWRTERAGRITPADGLDDNEWNTLADGASRIAAEVKQATGLRTVFHHHCATFVETPAEIDALMSRTDAATLGLCLDTGHATFGGGDPVAILDKWQSRIWHVHLKDCDPAVRASAAAAKWDYPTSVRNGVFCELGKGTVDFAAIVDRLKRTGYDGWLVVEQDVLPSMGAPGESAARNRAYLRSMGV